METKKELQHYIHTYHLEALQPFIKELSLRQYKDGEYLCYAGDAIESFSIIVQGKCKVMPNSQEGKVIILDYLEPVSFNGDIELLNDCAALYHVSAVELTTVIVIPKTVFFQTVMVNQEFLKIMCEKFAKKLYISSNNCSQTMLYPVKYRLCKLLLEQIRLQKTVEVKLKNTEISQKLGISERHVRRVLKEMEIAGLVMRKFGVLVCNQEMLEQMF